MKDLKFRSWDSILKYMIFSDEHKQLSDFLKESFEGREGFTIMQYTGLKDKNGKEIYEGDIVQFTTFSYIEPLESIIATVSYSARRMTFVFGEKSPLCFRSWDELTNDVYTHEIVVIGNTFENSELIEPTEQTQAE